MAWAAYRNKHGSLNLGFRIEQMGAIVALQMNRLAGGKAELYQFMPNQDQSVLALDQAMEQWI